MSVYLYFNFLQIELLMDFLCRSMHTKLKSKTIEILFEFLKSIPQSDIFHYLSTNGINLIFIYRIEQSRRIIKSTHFPSNRLV